MKPETLAPGVEKTERGPWCQTFMGGRFYPLDPRPEELEFEDLCLGLANTARFGGQTIAFYSVAQHCVHAHQAAMLLGGDEHQCAAALFHDAAEAWLGDMPRPIKVLLPEFQKIEAATMAAFEQRFAVDVASHHGFVKDVDNQVCEWERRVLLPNSAPWPGMPEPRFELELYPWPPFVAYQFFRTTALKVLDLRESTRH